MSNLLVLLLAAAVVHAAPTPAAPVFVAARTDCPNLDNCRPWDDINYALYPALTPVADGGYWMCVTPLSEGLNEYERTAWVPTADAAEHLDWKAKGECPPLAQLVGIVDENGLHQ
jgi:hypothetical protein